MENIKRLEYNKKAMEMYHAELKKAIEKEDDFEIYLNLGNLLYWIIMTEEWHKRHNKRYEKDKKNDNMVELMGSIRFANNSMKHNMMFRRLHLMPTAVYCGSPEAITGTFYCGTDEVLWNEIKYIEQKKKSRKKKQYDPDETRKKFYNYYNECFKLKNVIETLEPAIKFLINETDVYLP